MNSLLSTRLDHFLFRLIQGFSRRDQFNHVSFSFSQGTATQLLHGLKNGKVDLAFSLAAEDEPDIDFFPFVHQETVLIVPYDHPLANYYHVDLRIRLNFDIPL